MDDKKLISELILFCVDLRKVAPSSIASGLILAASSYLEFSNPMHTASAFRKWSLELAPKLDKHDPSAFDDTTDAGPLTKIISQIGIFWPQLAVSDQAIIWVWLDHLRKL